eukprot:gene7374-5189_t
MDTREVEDLKNSGNQHFSSGDTKAAVSDYQSAITKSNALLKDHVQSADREALRELQCALYSNLAWAQLTAGSFQESWEAAEAAVEINPKALKAWLRYVEARRSDGYPFEAFVALLLHVRPLLREEVSAGKRNSDEASTILKTAEKPLFQDLGLSDVDENLELVKYRNGVALVTRAPLKPNQVLFVESKCETPFDADLSLDDGNDTVLMVQRYAKQLRPHQKRRREDWDNFKKMLLGAWPRNLNEVSADMMEAVEPPLRSIYPDLDSDTFRELLQVSLVCQCNGFQSGFFRTCALANHSCTANIAMKFNRMTQKVKMLTVRDIAAGDFLNVKYLGDAHFLMGVGKRRDYLRSWLFWCDCERCIGDTKDEAEVEEVSCPGCSTYNIFPFTPNASTPDPVLLDLCSKPCKSCSSSLCPWFEKNEQKINNFLSEVTRSRSMSSVEELVSWIESMLSEVDALGLSPSHWMYRVLLYFFCEPLPPMLQNIISRMGASGEKGTVAALFRPTGVRRYYVPQIERYVEAKPDSCIFPREMVGKLGEGFDILTTFILLWHHISSFYPVHELWAVHKATCQLVLLQLLFQTPGASGYLSIDYATQLLQRHSHYLGPEDKSEFIHFLNLQKANATDPKSLPLSKIKKLFR